MQNDELNKLANSRMEVRDERKDIERWISDLETLMESDIFTSWEQDFVYDIFIRITHDQTLSTKQKIILRELHYKYREEF